MLVLHIDFLVLLVLSVCLQFEVAQAVIPHLSESPFTSTVMICYM